MVLFQSSKSQNKKWIVVFVIIFSIFIVTAIIIKIKYQGIEDNSLNITKEMNEDFDMANPINENAINNKNYYGTASDLVYRTIPDGSFHLRSGEMVHISSKENEYDNVYILDEFGRGKNCGKLNTTDTISFKPEIGSSCNYAIYSGNTNITDKLILEIGVLE